MTDSHATCLLGIDAHFAGRITPGRERAMRQHLVQCGQCRRRYERRMLLAELDPQALQDSVRIGRGLGVLRRAGAMRSPSIVLLAAAALFGVAVVLRPARSVMQDGEFMARGSGPIELASLEVYHAHPGNSFERASGSIRASDELAFAYTNQGAYAYLAVCGMDEHGHVYWYHPAWTSFAQNPDSVRIERGARLRELPEAISQSLDGRELRVVAVFSSDPLRVDAVEHVLATRHADRPLSLALSDAFGHLMVVERTFAVDP